MKTNVQDFSLAPVALTEPLLEQLYQLVRRAYEMYRQTPYTFGAVTQSHEQLRRRMHKDGTLVLGAFDGMQLIGSISLLPYSAALDKFFVEDGTDVCLEQFVVSPSHQRRGIGHALMSEAEEIAAQCGAVRLLLDTPAEASHLRRFYEAHGYSSIGQFQPFTTPQRNVVYRKGLHD